MKREFLPGWLLLIATTVLCQAAAGLWLHGGKQVVEASALAIIIGIIVRNTVRLPGYLSPGIAASEKLLIWGVVLLGAKLNFSDIKSQGVSILAIVIVTMGIGYFAVYILGRLFALSERLCILLAAGTTICGTSAIAITAPLIHAKEEETSYAVTTVALWGLVALLLYPHVASLLSVSDLQFGVFAGVAIHSTPQVVGAAVMFSAAAGATASAVKLVRNCFMAPLALVIGIWFSRKDPSLKAANINFSRAFPWFLFGYFAMAAMGTQGYLTPKGIDAFNEAGKFLIVVGMAGVGFNTVLKSFLSLGFRPLIIGFAGAVVVAISAATLITSLL